MALGTGRSSSILLLTCVPRPSARWNVTPEGRKSLCPAPRARCPEWSLVQTHAWQMFANDVKGPHLHLLLPVQPHVVNSQNCPHLCYGNSPHPCGTIGTADRVTIVTSASREPTSTLTGGPPGGEGSSRPLSCCWTVLSRAPRASQPGASQ